MCNISIDYRAFDSSYIIDIHEYLMKIHGICVSLKNKKCMTRPPLINLNPNEYSQELHYYPFVVKLDRCVGSCNTINDSSNKICVPNKTEDLKISVFKMIPGINESKTLTKHLFFKFKYKFDGGKINSNQKWNTDKCFCEYKKTYM